MHHKFQLRLDARESKSALYKKQGFSLASEIPLRLAIRRERAPVRLVRWLSILANGVSLFRLIESLKPEQINTPVEHTTDSRFPVRGGVASTCCGSAIAGATVTWPARLPVHEVNCINATADGLHAAECLRHVVEVCSGCVAEFLGLPVRKAVGQAVSLSATLLFLFGSLSYTSLMPLWMTESMVPLAHPFQLSAVPIVTPEKVDDISEIQPIR